MPKQWLISPNVCYSKTPSAFIHFNSDAVKPFIYQSKHRSSPPPPLLSVSASHHLTRKQEAHDGIRDQVCTTSSSRCRTVCEIGCTAQRDVCVINVTFYWLLHPSVYTGCQDHEGTGEGCGGSTGVGGVRFHLSRPCFCVHRRGTWARFISPLSLKEFMRRGCVQMIPVLGLLACYSGKGDLE